uniref:Uncharacterized protein n=1 Tax=Anguilla anguilla TaxID=7936 RepID=A0A0E9V2Y2_ANGAN
MLSHSCCAMAMPILFLFYTVFFYSIYLFEFFWGFSFFFYIG